MNEALPRPDGVPGTIDPTKLAGLFRQTTNSYKFLFFRTLLREARDRPSELIPWDRLACGMAQEAWWPKQHFRLSFGLNDQIGVAIARMTSPGREASQEAAERPGRGRRRGPGRLVADGAFERRQGILYYVPSRLLSPWFGGERPGEGASGAWEQRVARESVHRFAMSDPPLYRIEAGGIVLHEAWIAYLGVHAGIIQGWVDWHWCAWLQARNPSVPMVGTKIAEPRNRARPTAATAFWRAYLVQHGMACIYSRMPIDHDRFVLDHFVPHSFVGHSLAWNLVPTSATVNNRKLDAIPPRELVPALAAVHCAAIRFHCEAASPSREWVKLREEYLLDLRLAECELTKPELLSAALGRVLDPLIQISLSMSFPAMVRRHWLAEVEELADEPTFADARE